MQIDGLAFMRPALQEMMLLACLINAAGACGVRWDREHIFRMAGFPFEQPDFQAHVVYYEQLLGTLKLQQLQQEWEQQELQQMLEPQPKLSIVLNIGSFLNPAAPNSKSAAAVRNQGAPAAASGGAPPLVSSVIQAPLSAAGPLNQPGSSAVPSHASAAPQVSSNLTAAAGAAMTPEERLYTMFFAKDVAAPAIGTLAAPFSAAGVWGQRTHGI